MTACSKSFPASGDFCRPLITFDKSLDPDQARQNVEPDLDLNCLTLMVILSERHPMPDNLWRSPQVYAIPCRKPC